MNKYHDFVFKNNKDTGISSELFIDGVKPKGVRKVKIKSSAKGLNLVTVTYVANSINKE